MSRITVIGGHGKVALLLAPKLVEEGHEVTSVFRNPDHEPEVAATGATPRVADVESMDVAQLTDLLRGQDVVVWSAGAGGGNPARTEAVDRDAAIRSMDAAVAAGVPQYVMVSFFGVDQAQDVPEDNPFRVYALAKQAADEHLRGTDLAWTVLKPSMLTLAPSTAALDPAPTDSGDTSRELVADVICAVLTADRDAVAGTQLEFTDGDTPVDEAVAALRA